MEKRCGLDRQLSSPSTLSGDPAAFPMMKRGNVWVRHGSRPGTRRDDEYLSADRDDG
jgi:hypothetical protein